MTGVVRGLRHPALGFSKGMSSPLAKGVVQGHVRGAEHPTQAKRRVGCEFTLVRIVSYVPHAEIRRSAKYFGCAFEICNFGIL